MNFPGSARTSPRTFLRLDHIGMGCHMPFLSIMACTCTHHYLRSPPHIFRVQRRQPQELEGTQRRTRFQHTLAGMCSTPPLCHRWLRWTRNSRDQVLNRAVGFRLLCSEGITCCRRAPCDLFLECMSKYRSPCVRRCINHCRCRPKNCQGSRRQDISTNSLNPTCKESDICSVNILLTAFRMHHHTSMTCKSTFPQYIPQSHCTLCYYCWWGMASCTQGRTNPQHTQSKASCWYHQREGPSTSRCFRSENTRIAVGCCCRCRIHDRCTVDRHGT